MPLEPGAIHEIATTVTPGDAKEKIAMKKGQA